MRISKLKVLVILIFVLLCISLLYYFDSTKFDINKSPNNYNFYNSKIENEYLKYISDFIYPKKLIKFIPFETTTIPKNYTDKSTGYDVIDYFKYCGYIELFHSLFDKKRINFEDCPVTENFKTKFSSYLAKDFNIKYDDEDDVIIELKDNEKTFIVEVYILDGSSEPLYLYRYHFNYTLDEEGNIDDVIFVYKE